MAGKKGNPPQMGENQVKDLAGAMLKMMAVGFAGGIALISCAKKFGDTFLSDDAERADENSCEGEDFE